jgi:hypothetical protein
VSSCSLNFAIIALLAGGVHTAIPAFPAMADTRTARLQQCTMMLCVVQVPPDDILYIRKEPRVPEAQKRSNQLAGIPASTRLIENLDPAPVRMR